MPACALCGRPLAAGVFFVVRIDVFADPALPPASAGELAATDFKAELADVMNELKHLSADDAMDDVYRRFEYAVCKGCQRRVLANPLGRLKGTEPS